MRRSADRLRKRQAALHRMHATRAPRPVATKAKRLILLDRRFGTPLAAGGSGRSAIRDRLEE